MAFISELRARSRQIIFPVMGVLAVGYFAYHVVQGDRSLFAYWRYKQEVQHVQVMADAVRNQRLALEHRVSLLHPDSLDTDMLDERVRDMLNLGDDDEVVILTGRH